MSKELAEHHLENVGNRKTHRVDPDHVERFRDPERIERLRPEELVKKLKISVGDHVLEVGCGDGVFFDSLSEEVGEEGRVTGIDIEPGMVEAARDYATSKEFGNVQVKQSEDDSMPLQRNSIDNVLMVNVLHEMAYPTETLRELARVIKPGGSVLLYDRKKEETGPDGPPIHHLVSRGEADELFERAGFEIVHEFDWDPRMYSLIFKERLSYACAGFRAC